jgi:hypothetical protein
MLSPARRHMQKALAAKSANSDAGSNQQTSDLYTLMQAALWEARRTLKGIQSVQAKIAKKKELLPEFDAYIDGVLEGKKGTQDEVLMNCMIWHFDTGNFQRGMDIASYALAHGLTTPDQYQRDTAAIVAEEMAEATLRLASDEEVGTLLEHLTRAVEMTASADIHDQIRAKLFKARGYAFRANNQLPAALADLQAALQLNDKVGVKKDIEKLERDIKNAQQPTS